MILYIPQRTYIFTITYFNVCIELSKLYICSYLKNYIYTFIIILQYLIYLIYIRIKTYILENIS